MIFWFMNEYELKQKSYNGWPVKLLQEKELSVVDILKTQDTKN